jgi:uncharacterized membrane protein YgcG
MSIPSRLLSRTFLVGVLIVSTAYGASALTVKRTNKLIDGVYVPVLVVRSGGETYIHQIGEDGLTRSILFDRDLALAWARAKYGADATDVADATKDGKSGGGSAGSATGGGSSDGGDDGGGADDDDDDDCNDPCGC